MFFIVDVVVAILDHVLGKWIIKTTRALGTRAKKLLPTNTTARARKCVKNEVTGTTPVALKRFFFFFFSKRSHVCWLPHKTAHRKYNKYNKITRILIPMERLPKTASGNGPFMTSLPQKLVQCLHSCFTRVEGLSVWAVFVEMCKKSSANLTCRRCFSLEAVWFSLFAVSLLWRLYPPKKRSKMMIISQRIIHAPTPVSYLFCW